MYEKKLNQLYAVSRTQQGGRRNLVLRHSVSHIPPSSEGIACWNSTSWLTSTPERRNELKINVSKYFISSSSDQTHNQSILQSHFVP